MSFLSNPTTSKFVKYLAAGTFAASPLMIAGIYYYRRDQDPRQELKNPESVSQLQQKCDKIANCFGGGSPEPRVT